MNKKVGGKAPLQGGAGQHNGQSHQAGEAKFS
jgi:hypothetical protein